MKNFGKIFLLAFLQAGIILLLPLFMTGSAEPAQESVPYEAVMAASPAEAQPETAAAVEASPDELTRIRLIDGGQTLTLSLGDYLAGVVAAEMPVSFEPEALKAQAAAARTYALYRVASGVHDGAVCSDPNCCEAWLSEETLRGKWGAAYEEYMGKIQRAVAATDGLCLSYEGRPILAAFHSCSGGQTESSENVFSQALPYLVSVESMEEPESIPNYITTVTLDKEALYSAVAAWNAEAAAAASEEAILTEAVWSPTGRLLRVKLCGEEISGSELRKIFSLRSALVSWRRQEDGSLVFTVTGYGHGVGMSQYGANAMAKNGADWRAILAHFYPGAALTPLSELETAEAA